MKVTDYIVEFLIKKGITDVFGYPGGMVTNLMNSFARYSGKIEAHVCYHEQAASFAACAYAQIAERAGVAYATSGPGATNLITGICNAYFDSQPVIFITGQINTHEQCGNLKIRQRGFQETNIVYMVSGVTKYSVQIDKAEKIAYYLEKAYYIANQGRKGPVLIDLPMDIQTQDIEVEKLEHFKIEKEKVVDDLNYSVLLEALSYAQRPCIIAGAGLKGDRTKRAFLKLVQKLQIPVVTSMIAIDLLSSDNSCNYGFLGAYGDRTANFIVAKSDLIITLGARLDVRQVGKERGKFASNGKIIRIDIDESELLYKVRDDEKDICADAFDVMEFLLERYKGSIEKYEQWRNICNKIRKCLDKKDYQQVNYIMEKISDRVPENAVITTDVGQNQVWVAQSFKHTVEQKIAFSGGHGAMGYSLPAAIGAYYATNRNVISICGDGGFLMNMQELQTISRDNLPIKIIVFNNHALGMIRHFQEMYFDGNYSQTVEGNGYSVPDLKKVAKAFSLEYMRLGKNYSKLQEIFSNNRAAIIEVNVMEPTYAFPKLRFGQPNQDQEPLIDRELYMELMGL